jgi:hypothetical protein
MENEGAELQQTRCGGQPRGACPSSKPTLIQIQHPPLRQRQLPDRPTSSSVVHLLPRLKSHEHG